MFKRAIQFVALSAATVASAAFLRWWTIRQKRKPAPNPLSLLHPIKEDVTLTRFNGDKLEIAWKINSSRTSLRLYAVNVPNKLSPEPHIIERNQSVKVQINPELRYAVAITFDDGQTLQVMERVVPLKSVPNFRDIGGYQTKGGKRVRWNRVFRASRLSNLTPYDSKQLGAMGIKIVCDMRTAEEVEAEPDNLPDNIRLFNLPVESNANRWLELGRILFVEDYLTNFLFNAYCNVMIDQNPQVIGKFFRLLADEASYPLVAHCAAGKDRTGITTAMLLDILGVPDETIIADYTLSNLYYEFFRETTQKLMVQLQIMGVDESDFDYLLIADGQLMQRTLHHVRQKYGSIESYLIFQAGVPSKTLDKIRQLLLE